MTKLAEIQDAIRRLAPKEQQALRHWLDETLEETPAMLAAIDEGLCSLKTKRTKTFTQAELETMGWRWAGVN
jgi:hypothetical protein